MTRLIIYLILFTTCCYLLATWVTTRRRHEGVQGGKRRRSIFRSKKHPLEPWAQVYETDSQEEAQAIQARLEEEEIECLIFEQGRKSVHGEPLKRIGIVVARSALARAQSIVSRIPS
jgi:hypothetical protein